MLSHVSRSELGEGPVSEIAVHGKEFDERGGYVGIVCLRADRRRVCVDLVSLGSCPRAPG